MKRWLHLGPYALIAAACALLNVAVMILGDRAGLHYAVSTAISFCLCVVVGYSLHSRFTFLVLPSVAGLRRYTTAMALNFPLALASMWFFHDAMGIAIGAAAVASTAALTAYNYLSSRWAIAARAREARQ
ncbi:MAG TPA: GtrA family protein [Sphingomicrobium sp.]|jgi:putative flippase GtrA|nr:GtrA family protein [Sphingomicrobium sp.]